MAPPEHKHLQRAWLTSVPFSARMIAWLSLRPSKHVRLKTTAVLTTARLNPTPLTRAPASSYENAPSPTTPYAERKPMTTTLYQFALCRCHSSVEYFRQSG
jgi:hypothetical protein